MTTTPKFCLESLQIHTGEISTARQLLFRLLNQLQAKADDHSQSGKSIAPFEIKEDCTALHFILGCLDQNLDGVKEEIGRLVAKDPNATKVDMGD